MVYLGRVRVSGRDDVCRLDGRKGTVKYVGVRIWDANCFVIRGYAWFVHDRTAISLLVYALADDVIDESGV